MQENQISADTSEKKSIRLDPFEAIPKIYFLLNKFEIILSMKIIGQEVLTNTLAH